MSFDEGVERFNARRFWDAHESWEELWLESEGDERTYLQGLIQLAAAYHHIVRGNARGAARLLHASLAKLGCLPDGYRGIDRAEAVAAASRHVDDLERGGAITRLELPKLRYNQDLS